MNQIIRNTIVVALSAVTLAGGLFRPPYVEPAEAAKVPSIQILRSSDQATALNAIPSTLQKLSASYTDTLERNGQTYVPVRDYVEAQSGKVIYNPETKTVDIIVGQASFSLLLSEDAILSDGRWTEGGFVLHNGAAYLLTDILSSLIGNYGEAAQARA